MASLFQDGNPEECPVCFMAYDCTSRRPRTLPCGHSLCTPCIDGIKQQSVVTCPTCRGRHTVPKAGQFPVSYGMEALVKGMMSLKSTCPSPKSAKGTADPTPWPSAGPSTKGPKGLSRAVQSLLQEHDGKIVSAIHASQEAQTQLDQYQTSMAGWKEQQQHCKDRLQELMDQIETAGKLLRQEQSKAFEKKQQLHQMEQQLHALLQTVRAAATREEAYEVIDDAVHSLDEGRQREEECVTIFPDVSTVTTIIKTIEVTRAAVQAAASVQACQEQVGAVSAAAAAGKSSLPPSVASSSSSISDRVDALVLPALRAEDLRCLKPHSLQAGGLRGLTQRARDLLQRGLLFVVHKTEEGQSRHGRISLEDGCLYLHHLQEQALPRGAATVQVEEVLAATPPWRVFLQLAWPGRAPRSVIVQVPRNRQFLLLCTGQRGPCYAHTRLWEVRYKRLPWECVCGGDYEHNDGSGGAVLLPLPDEDKARVPWRAGQVWRCGGNNPAVGAQFAIATKDKPGGYVSRDVFGQVEEGLQVVREAAQHHTITQVTVEDCGAVLWRQ